VSQSLYRYANPLSAHIEMETDVEQGVPLQGLSEISTQLHNNPHETLHHLSLSRDCIGLYKMIMYADLLTS
jgi:hypothetical protein